MAYGVDYGNWIPDNQGSRTCSMCYGDPDHGKDGYYRQWIEDQERAHERQPEIEQPDKEASDDTK